MKISCARAGKCDNAISTMATPPTCQSNPYRLVKGTEGDLPVFASKEPLLKSHMFLTPTSFHHVLVHPMCRRTCTRIWVCPDRAYLLFFGMYRSTSTFHFLGSTPSFNFKVSVKDKTSIRTTCLSACTYNMRLNSPRQCQGQGLKAAPGTPAMPWISVDRPALSNQP
jgi:hypothetical protein